MMTLEEAISAKAAEVENHKGVLKRYGSGRWYDQSLRYLRSLEAELAELQRQLADSSE